MSESSRSPRRHRARAQLAPGFAVWLVLSALGACNAYDGGLLREPDRPTGPNGPDAGGGDGGNQDGGGGDGGEPMCLPVPEQCNRRDDDCDGKTDEDTAEVCEQTIVNAEVQCVAFGMTARCVLVRCREGYANCDGDPSNGCEPFCMCNACDDAGTEDGGL
jgi:hypothetical protein